MVASLRRLGQLWAFAARLDLTWFLRDTKYCLLCILADLISSASAIAGVWLLAQRFGSIGGMSADQVLFMLGYAALVDGVIGMFFGMNNIAWISRLIGRGQLDHRLLQPVPLWMQFLTEGFIPVSGSSTLLAGLAVTGWAAQRLALPIGAIWLVSLAAAVGCSVAVVLSYSWIAGSLAFYAPVAGEEISTSAMGLFSSLQSFPLGGLSLTAQCLLTTLVPVGLAAWFPANLLLRQAPGRLPTVLFALITITLTVLATTLFRKGMRHYAQRGSVRYHDRGHRR